jgi:hypothetical protein
MEVKVRRRAAAILRAALKHGANKKAPRKALDY